MLTGVNDHYLKYQYPGFITGKLSDFTGLFYFPLFICAVAVLAVRLVTKDFVFNRALLISSIVFTDVIFCLMKLNSNFKDVFVSWFSNRFFSIAVISDPTDLVALVASVACYYFASRYFELKTIAE